VADSRVDPAELERLGLYDPDDEHAAERLESEDRRGVRRSVDSTSLGQQLSIGDFGAALTEFDTRAIDTVVDGGGRLVKPIGDEAMFIAPDAGTACAIARDLVGGFADHPVLPLARGGLAAGEVLSREGDYFGPVVNLAARAATLADPGCVLASGDLARQATGYRFSSIGPQRLKGFDEPVELFGWIRAS
jgi:adenylate cyclase